nr:hypothetical protein GCM10020241_24630 [Streptoalloteichus tenebrarius]
MDAGVGAPHPHGHVGHGPADSVHAGVNDGVAGAAKPIAGGVDTAGVGGDLAHHHGVDLAF